MVDAILKEADSGSKEHTPYPATYVSGGSGDYIANYDKIRNDTAWEPKIGLAEGVRRMVAYYKENRKFY